MTGIGYPRSLIEHQRLQLLVLLQTAHERGLGALLALPLVDDGLHLRRLVEQVGREAVGIEGCGLADGVVVDGLRHGGKGLNHQPSGVVGVLNGERGERRVR